MADSAGASDLILWVYPVYTFLVPWQLMELLSLLEESGLASRFQGKYSSQILTSKHFYDNTAALYMDRMTESMGMRTLHPHYPDMDDLGTARGRQQLMIFGRKVLESVEQKYPVALRFSDREPLKLPRYILDSGGSGNASPGAVDPKAGEGIVIVTDCREEDLNLAGMIERYRSRMPAAKVVNLNDFKFQGGCMGCFHCAFDAKCIYTDGFDRFHREEVMSAESLIYAAVIDRHWFRPVWKCFDDRQFYNGHRTTMMGKSIGYLISGNLKEEPELRNVLEARSEVGHLYLTGIVTDEAQDPAVTSALIDRLADETRYAVSERPSRPASFAGVGGMKVFRDLIYVMRGLMQEDHRFYKKMKIYDFPHKKVKTILLMKIVGLMMKSPRMRKRGAVMMNESIRRQYDRIIEKY